MEESGGLGAAALLPLECAEALTYAINDYAIVRQRIEQPALLYDDHELAAALAALPALSFFPLREGLHQAWLR